MTAPTTISPELDGLAWHDNGQSVMSGPVLGLFESLDQAFLSLAAAWNASEYRFPTFVSARQLHRLDYFRSFPHLATFPVCLDAEDANLGDFVDGPVLDDHGHVHLTRPRPIEDVLTPAACYHLYIHLQNTESSGCRYLTTRNTCFRREEYYRPLERQWSFSMREIVAIGTLEEVRDFLHVTHGMVNELLAGIDLPVAWETANDPFFRPAGNAKYMAQLVNPTKQEAVFDGHLAIASINLHQDHFGRTYDIRRSGDYAYTGCVAFGLERWVYAFIKRFGADPTGWPRLDDVLTVASRGSS
jgi:seryl-tRNA synthetase